MVSSHNSDNKTLSDVPVEEETPKTVIPTPGDSKKMPRDERVFDPKTPPLISRKGFVGVLLLVTLIAVSVGVVVTLQKSQPEVAGSKTSSLADQREVATLMEQVSRHYLLPQGEQATIATVSDVTQLENNAFFEHAQNGDKVIIYSQSGVAILYRPSIDKVVAVGPVSQEQENTIQTTVTLTPHASESAER